MGIVSSRKIAVFCLVAVVLAPTGIATSSTATITYIEDDITGETTWSAEEGPYRIAEDITIERGATLEIEPGTTVQPAEDITITVRGNLTANGTAAAPVGFETAPQAPADIHWGTIRYNGSSNSRLSLSHTTLETARSAVTVTSSEGTVDLSSVAVRSTARSGIEVTDVSVPPRLSIADSSFANISGRGVAIAPASGAVAGSEIRPNFTELDARATHRIALSTRTDVTGDTLAVDYRGHGDVDRVTASSIERFGIDTNGDGEIDRSLASHVEAVGHRSNAFAIELNRSVRLRADESLLVRYDNVTNPKTYGTYPVSIRIRDRGVEQLADTTLPLNIRTTERARALGESDGSRASRFRIVDSTFEAIDDQAVFVAAETARNFEVRGNLIRGIGGSGLAVRSERTADFQVSRNRISETETGIRIYTRNDALGRFEITSNTITQSTTGLSVRHTHMGRSTVDRLSMRVADNRIAQNSRHGISVVAHRARLTGLDVQHNEITDNGRAGLYLGGGHVVHSTLANNTIAENSNVGVAIESEQARHLRVADNEIGRNGDHGLSLRTELLVDNVSVDSNTVFDNAAIGLDLDNQLTHAGTLNVTRNTVTANAYGVRIAGSVDASVRNNSIVHNTYGFDTPARLAGYAPGTGMIVEEGAAGAIFRAGDVSEQLTELLDDPDVRAKFGPGSSDDSMVVLRPDGPNTLWKPDRSALTVRTLTRELPTGIVLSKDDDRRARVRVRDNDVYGHRRGMVVNVSTLVDANTTTRLLLNATQTVVAERNYWGAPDGPTHSSIHPEGTGDRIVTRNGWVDFLPSTASHVHAPKHRPQANLTVSTTTPRVGEELRISAAGSSDPDGAVETYRFRTDGSERTATDPVFAVTFERPGERTVAISVEDELGVESADPATVTLTVRDRQNATDEPNTTTPTTTGSAERATTTVAETTTQSADVSLSGAPFFSSIGGFLGFVFYGIGLVLGSYGALQTVRSTPVTVSGLTINGFAAGGVLIWIGFGLLGTDGLLRIGVGAGVLWLALVLALWALSVVLD
ncbi:right-handed parallel beta-helix repeat-containing protein [Halorussus marinus]|uniref:right-handed parallel beta-helix repeat-containing protein n=1 Tax=Halorussus marinus TaxID=2505976 RepID=UPI00106E0653|nr:right-handed parallel beta-helix repeat-containing protein [Halorussus marinus]